ncbi:MAG: hypothetical protein U0V74_10200 [Chitinophagales bacterium]
MRKFVVSVLGNGFRGITGVELVFDQETYPSKKQIREAFDKKFDHLKPEIKLIVVTEISERDYKDYNVE